MDTGGLSGGISSGMLGLGMPPHQQQLSSQSSHPSQLSQMGSYSHHEAAAVAVPQSAKPGSPYGAKSKQALTLSDDDELGIHGDDCGDGDGKSKASLWHRMKWTDEMVKMLIMAVFYFGDEGGAWSECGNDPKKKTAGGLLQKKGKWKSVSQAMMEKGFCVSPQQCEDKFNDLNKRYKRVTDILGKGTACLVVENQSLLDNMDLSLKLKEEVKKLLNSKHLFFREMCAYHNSCSHGVGGGSSSGGLGGHHSPEMAVHPHLQQKSTHQLPCFHSSEIATAQEDSGRMEPAMGGSCEEEFHDEEDDDKDDTDDGEDEEEDDIVDHEDCRHNPRDRGLRKRPRKAPCSHSSPLTQQLSSELTRLVGNVNKSPWEKRHWMKLKLLQLEEQEVSYQLQGFELEQQRVKWAKFSTKKERDMERAKLENDRRRLENERMMLLVRQKELELVDIHQQHQHSSSSTLPTGETVLHRSSSRN